MRFTLQIDCDNEAFDDGANGLCEVGRILTNLADKLDANEYGNLFDVNGNRVGFYKLSE